MGVQFGWEQLGEAGFPAERTGDVGVAGDEGFAYLLLYLSSRPSGLATASPVKFWNNRRSYPRSLNIL